ncbi:MAG: aminopeptidase P family protein [Actinobacteria bacterium]|nr:aminopeptidase P family protein [Actinomycetota bacterium]NBY15844.1 aminopeptidase P family protein [Actinomycetota bacterium]
MTSRITRVQDVLPADEALLVTKPANVRYLSGYSGSNGIVLLTQSDATLFTDSRYAIQASSECFDVNIVISSDLFKGAAELAKGSDLQIEARHLTVGAFNRLSDLLAPNRIKVSAVGIESFRVVKDENEIALIEQACQIATSALNQVTSINLIGRTEREIARLLEFEMLNLGAEAIGFETIVASGPNSAIAHHQPTGRALSQGDLLKIDFGARVSGYHSDCTRTFVAGKPNQWQQDLYSLVLSAQTNSRSVLTGGVTASEVVKPTMVEFEKAGLLTNFGHGLGHGVGLEIHEDPFLSNKLDDTLDPGTVLTVEPGLYFPDQGGVRIEDTVVVTSYGYRTLTDYSYDLIEIGK